MNESINSTSESTSFTYQLWNNKVVLAIILLFLIIVIVFVPNGVLLGFLVALLSLIICLKQNSWKEAGFGRPFSWGRVIFLGLVLGIVIQLFLSIVYDPLLERLTGEPIDYSQFETMVGNLPMLLLWLLVGWVVGGFFEELTFRGYMMTRIRKVVGHNVLGTTLAVLLTGIPFGLAHAYQGLSGMLSTGSVGILLGLIFVRNNYNIWLLIIIHGVVNTVGLAFIYFDLNHFVNNLFL